MCLRIKNRFKLVIKGFFLILFVYYIGNISLFTHSHVVDGVTIKHSHPYPIKDGAQNHHHTKGQFHLIQALSAFFVTTSILLLFSLVGLYNLSIPLKNWVDVVLVRPGWNHYLFSRPPPAL